MNSSYIIDHYSTLSGITIFHHAGRYQWHNDDPSYDAQRLLSNFRLKYVLNRGYANLRCIWTIGCPPDGIYPHMIRQPSEITDRDGAGNVVDYNVIYKEVFEVLFPGIRIPDRIRAPCCAQSVVTAQNIRRRPRQEYERFRTWLLETELRYDVSGRIMEYFWHCKCIPQYCSEANSPFLISVC